MDLLEQQARIAAYLGAGDGFDRALGAFAETYADQNERDHGAVREAVAAGRVAAPSTADPGTT